MQHNIEPGDSIKVLGNDGRVGVHQWDGNKWDNTGAEGMADFVMLKKVAGLALKPATPHALIWANDNSWPLDTDGDYVIAHDRVLHLVIPILQGGLSVYNQENTIGITLDNCYRMLALMTLERANAALIASASDSEDVVDRARKYVADHHPAASAPPKPSNGAST